MNMHKRIAACAISAAFLGGGVVLAPAAQAHESVVQPAACYDTAHTYSKPSGTGYYPTPGTHLKATTNCAGISIKPSTSRWVSVCFSPSDGSGDFCQSAYTLAPAGEWTVISASVKDNTLFYFNFDSTAASTGSWAA